MHTTERCCMLGKNDVRCNFEKFSGRLESKVPRWILHYFFVFKRLCPYLHARYSVFQLIIFLEYDVSCKSDLHTPISSADTKSLKNPSKIQARIRPKSVTSSQISKNCRTKTECVNPAVVCKGQRENFFDRLERMAKFPSF